MLSYQLDLLLSVTSHGSHTLHKNWPLHECHSNPVVVIIIKDCKKSCLSGSPSRWVWCWTVGRWSRPSPAIRTWRVRQRLTPVWLRWREETRPTSNWREETWWAAGNTPPSPASWSSPRREKFTQKIQTFIQQKAVFMSVSAGHLFYMHEHACWGQGCTLYGTFH